MDQTYFEGWWEGASLFIHPASLQREGSTSSYSPPYHYTPPTLAAGPPPLGSQPILCSKGKPTDVGDSQGRVLSYSGLSAGLAVLLATWAVGGRLRGEWGVVGGLGALCGNACRREWGQGWHARACV